MVQPSFIPKSTVSHLSLDLLSKPETYANNTSLRQFCQQYLMRKMDMPYGKAKKILLAGKAPELVLDELTELADQLNNLWECRQQLGGYGYDVHEFDNVEFSKFDIGPYTDATTPIEHIRAMRYSLDCDTPGLINETTIKLDRLFKVGKKIRASMHDPYFYNLNEYRYPVAFYVEGENWRNRIFFACTGEAQQFCDEFNRFGENPVGIEA